MIICIEIRSMIYGINRSLFKMETKTWYVILSAKENDKIILEKEK